MIGGWRICDPVNVGPNDNSRQGLWMGERAMQLVNERNSNQESEAKSAVEEVLYVI